MTEAEPRTDWRALAVLLFVVYINIAGFGVVLPLLPFFGESFHAPAWQVTLLFSAFSTGQFLGEPFWGRLSDRVGRRPVLMTTIAVSGLAYAALALAPSIWLAFAVRFVGGFFSGNISTLQSCMADVTPPHQRAGRMGLMGMAFGIGFMTGPSLGGFLAQPQLGTAGFHLPLFAAAGLCLTSALGVALFVKETLKTKGPRRHTRPAPLREAFAHPVISRVLMVSFVVVSGFAGIEAIYGLWTADRFGWGPQQIGLVFMLAGLIGAVGQGIVTGRLARRFGEARVLIAALALMATGMVVQFLSPSWPLAVAGLAIVATGQSMCFPNLTALTSRSAPPERQGEMLGLNMGSNALARIGGPIYAGQLFSHVGPSAPFVLGAALILPAIWLAWQIARRMPLRA